MPIFQRFITLIAAILFIPSTINTVLQFNDYLKKMKILHKSKGSGHPLKKSIFQSSFITIILFMIFYILGGFSFIHDYLYPLPRPKAIVIKVHDTITLHKHDTIYIKSPSQARFDNKINKVDRLDEH